MTKPLTATRALCALFVFAFGLAAPAFADGPKPLSPAECAVTLANVENLRALVAQSIDAEASRIVEGMGTSETSVWPLLKGGIILSTKKPPIQERAVELLIARNNITALTLLLSSGMLDEELQGKVAQTLATDMPRALILGISTNKKVPLERRMELIREAISHAGFGEAGGLFSTSLQAVRPSALRAAPFKWRFFGFVMRMAARVIPSYRRSSRQSTLDKMGVSAEEQESLLRLTMRHDPLSPMMAIANAAFTEDAPLDVPGESDDLRRAMTRFSALRPDLLPGSWLQIATGSTGRREVALGLVRQMHRLSDEGSPLPTFVDAADVISRAAGLDYAAISTAKYSRETLPNLIDLVLDLQQGLSAPAFEGVAIESDLLQEKKLGRILGLLTNLKNLLYLSGGNDAAWAAIRADLRLDSGITAADIDSLIGRTREAVRGALERVLQSAGGDAISIAQFEELSSRWRDTKDIFTLIARFNARVGWRGEIKVMAKILKAELEGRFLELKRHGAPGDVEDQQKARAQTAVLDTPEKQDAWWRQWSEVALHEPRGAMPAAEGDAALLQAVMTELRAEAQALRDRFRNAAEPEHAAQLFTGLLQGSEPAGAALTAMGADDHERAMAIANMLVNRMMDPTLAPRDARKALAFLKTLVARDGAVLEEGQGMEVSSAIGRMFTILKRAPSAELPQGGEIIVTTTSMAPRILLSIGSLVNAGSCMHPETGSRAQAIPSVALDANIQAIFSTALNQGDFASARDFSLLKSWLRQDAASVESSFEGNQGIFTFRNIRTQETVTSGAMRSAYYRYQLKVGTAKNGQPGIRTEKPFAIDHAARRVMRDQIRSIKRRMAEAMGGRVDVAVSMPATRNLPGGTFSDALYGATGAGTSMRSYVIPRHRFAEPR